LFAAYRLDLGMQQLIFWVLMSVVLVAGSVGLARATVDMRRDNRERSNRGLRREPEGGALRNRPR